MTIVAVIDHVRSPHLLGYEVAELEPESLLWGASGRSILTFLPEEAEMGTARIRTG